MTPIEIFNELSKKDSYELLIHLKWLAKKINCSDCIQTRKKISGEPPNCRKCVPASKLMKQHFKNL